MNRGADDANDPINDFSLAERNCGGRAVQNNAISRLDAVPVAEPGDGRNCCCALLFLSLDPYMRGRMSAARSYAPPVEIGAVMTGETVAGGS